MNLLSDIHVIVFDFDGVIINSEGAKRASWYNLLSTINDPVFSWKDFDHDALIAEAHRVWIDGTAKGSRYEIIEHMMDAVGYPKTKEAIDWYANEYNWLVQDGIMKAGVSAETTEALRTLGAHFPLYLNSATPETALLQSVQTLGIRDFFKSVLGKTEEKREKSKVENIKIAIAQESTTAQKTLFVGDAVSDFKAALEVECSFIRFTGFDTEQKKWDPEAPHTIQTLGELILSI